MKRILLPLCLAGSFLATCPLAGCVVREHDRVVYDRDRDHAVDRQEVRHDEPREEPRHDDSVRVDVRP